MVALFDKIRQSIKVKLRCSLCGLCQSIKRWRCEMLEEDQREGFVVLITGVNSEKTFGPFFSIEEIWNKLKELGFEKKSDTWWQKSKVDAYIKQLNSPDKIGQ